jgi:hypothetical protein
MKSYGFLFILVGYKEFFEQFRVGIVKGIGL